MPTSQAFSHHFGLIVDLIEASTAAIKIEFAREQDQIAECEAQAEVLNAVYDAGFRWASYTAPDTARRVPQLIASLQSQCDGEFGANVYEAFVNGYDDSLHQRCIFPKQRPLDDRPAHLAAENGHFMLTHRSGAAMIVSKNEAGGFGSVELTPAIFAHTFAIVAEGKPESAKYLYNADPYGTFRPTQTLIRDDLTAGWDDVSDDPDPPRHKHNSDTLGELYLRVEHPGNGRLYFGAVAQEAQQLRSFLELRDHVAQMFAEARSPQRLAEAKMRAADINKRVAVSFLCGSGHCPRCEIDVTPLLSASTGSSTITGCPVCGATWCD